MSLPLARIRGDSRFGIRQAGEPLGGHMPYVVGHRFSLFDLSRCVGLRLLLGQLTRMHHDKAPLCLRCSPCTGLDLPLPHDAWPMPAPGRLRLGPPRLLRQQGQGRLLLPPRFEFLAHGTRAWHEGH
jgi:hypothetical protein